MYSTRAITPKIYGLPKVQKKKHPLRPIVSSRGSINYEVAKELSRILRPLVGKSPHHIKNTGDFVQQVTGITLQPGECITSYDVSALFTSVPIEPAITIIRRQLQLDQELHKRATMKVEQIISLLEFCLKTTYFQFQGRFCEQLQGAPMASPISLFVTNLYMEDFEINAINSAENPPRMCKRYVNDTFVVTESARKERFLEHINNMDPHIQFTTEDAKPDGSLPFLDTIVLPQPDNSLLTTVDRKQTHTQICICCGGSHHHLLAQYSVINTLKHRARTVCSNQQLLKEEEDHLNKAWTICKYPAWALNRVSIRSKMNNRPKNNNINKNSNGYNQEQTLHSGALHERIK